MAENTPSQRVLAGFAPFMVAEGFTYRKKNNEFSRKVEHATHHFQVGFDGRGGLVSTNAHVFVTYDEIDSMCNKAFGCDGQWRVASRGSTSAGRYDIYVEEYAALTPREKGKIDPALIHPQERVDGAVSSLINTYLTVAAPLFERLETHRQLADMWMEETGFGSRIDRIRMVQLLSAGLGDDPGWANTEVEDLLAMLPLRRDLAASMEKLRIFIASSNPDELLFKNREVKYQWRPG